MHGRSEVLRKPNGLAGDLGQIPLAEGSQQPGHDASKKKGICKDVVLIETNSRERTDLSYRNATSNTLGFLGFGCIII